MPRYRVHYIERGTYETEADSDSAARQDFIDNGPRNRTEITGQEVDRIVLLLDTGSRRQAAAAEIIAGIPNLGIGCPTIVAGRRYMLVQRGGSSFTTRWVMFDDDPIALYRAGDDEEGWTTEALYDLDTGQQVHIRREYVID